MKKLDNKVAIITGAGAGIGKAISQLFYEEGCKILAIDIKQERLEVLEKEINTAGGEIKTLLSNMMKEEDIEEMFKVVMDTYGTLDILVNNAGIMDNFSPVGEVDNDVWERVMKTNAEGPFKTMRSAIKIFLKKKEGIIVNIASLGGLKGGTAGAAYTASKHALIGLTRNTGYMYSKMGIRCNAIAPGAVNSSISETIDRSKMTPLIKDRIMTGMAINPKIGDPPEIAKVALFLSCEDSSFINGSVLTVDGGWGAY